MRIRRLPFSAAVASVARIDEQGFHMPLYDQHERKRLISLVDREQQWSGREEVADEHFERDAIFRQEEVVRRIYRCAPDLDDADSVIVARRADRDHLAAMP
jgi:hypothetical protein